MRKTGAGEEEKGQSESGDNGRNRKENKPNEPKCNSNIDLYTEVFIHRTRVDFSSLPDGFPHPRRFRRHHQISENLKPDQTNPPLYLLTNVFQIEEDERHGLDVRDLPDRVRSRTRVGAARVGEWIL